MAKAAETTDRTGLYRLEWWNGVSWETSPRHKRLTLAEWARIAPAVKRDWGRWRLLKSIVVDGSDAK